MNVRRRQYVTAADAAKLLGKSDRTIRRWIKARHTAHNRYEIALDDIEALVEQQEGKEYVNPVELLRTLSQQVEALTHEVEALKGQMAYQCLLDEKDEVGGQRVLSTSYVVITFPTAPSRT